MLDHPYLPCVSYQYMSLECVSSLDFLTYSFAAIERKKELADDEGRFNPPHHTNNNITRLIRRRRPRMVYRIISKNVVARK